MTLPEWPAGLPQADISLAPQSPFRRTQMESGLARQRRRFRVYPVQVTANFLMDGPQYSAYCQFSDQSLNGWASWFLMTISDERGIRNARVRFVGAPKADRISNRPLWRLSATLEKLNID